MFKVHAPQLVRVAELNPSAYNPRKIPPEKFEALKESIRLDGFLEPLVVQKSGLRIIGGHQRFRAIKEICVEAGELCPDLHCVVLDVDDRAAKRLNIKLNKIQGEFEARMLGELLIDIYEDKPLVISEDSALLGFIQDEAATFIRLVDPDMVPAPGRVDGELGEFGKSITLSVEFETVAMRDKVKALLVENARVAKKKPGDIVAAALGLVKRKVVAKRGKTAA